MSECAVEPDDQDDDFECDCCHRLTDDELRELIRGRLQHIGMTWPELQAQARLGWFESFDQRWAWMVISSVPDYVDVQAP